MPVLPLRNSYSLTMASVTKAYDAFGPETDYLLYPFGMEFQQGSRNFAWGIDNNSPADPASGLAGGDYFGVFFGRFDGTNFRTAGIYDNFVASWNYETKLRAEVAGQVYYGEQVISDGIGGTFGFEFWRSDFALNGTNTRDVVSKVTADMGGAWSEGGQYVISWPNYQVDWPTDKVMVMGYRERYATGFTLAATLPATLPSNHPSGYGTLAFASAATRVRGLPFNAYLYAGVNLATTQPNPSSYPTSDTEIASDESMSITYDFVLANGGFTLDGTLSRPVPDSDFTGAGASTDFSFTAGAGNPSALHPWTSVVTHGADTISVSQSSGAPTGSTTSFQFDAVAEDFFDYTVTGAIRLFGMVLDGTDTIEAINIAELDAGITKAVMIGNNQLAGDNDAALFLTDSDGARHLTRMQWTAHPFDGGAGTFEATTETYTFDDAELNALLSADIGNVDALKGIATHNDCNFLICLRSKQEGPYGPGIDINDPFLIVVSKNWDWYDKVTLTAGEEDFDAWDILQNYTGGSAGNIAYNEEEGLLYLASGGADPFTYLTAEFSPCDGGEGVVDEDVTLRVWGFSLDDHDFAVFRLGAIETLVFDLTTKQWAEWSSPLLDYWKAHVGQNWIGATGSVASGTDIVAGDDVNGTLYILDPAAGRDDDPTTGTPATFNRRVTGSVDLRGRTSAACNAVQLKTSLGAPTETGAEFTLRTSDDVGQTWTNHGNVVVPAGDYGTVVEWRALGLMRQPGRLFAIEDNGAAVRISGAELR